MATTGSATANRRKSVDIDEYVRAAGGLSISHPGGNLASHLARVAVRLSRWQMRQEVVDAGHLHAVYGTDGFGHTVKDHGARQVIVDLIGAEAEDLIFLYCRCDREASYPSWGSEEPFVVDREEGQTIGISEKQRQALINITVANEIDVLDHDTDLMRQHGDKLAILFGHWRPWLTRPGLTDLNDWMSRRLNSK